jgi:hypothetical protein
MLDQGDCLMVVLLATTLQDLKQICSALGVAKATQPNHSTQPESTTELTDSLLQQILSSGAAMIAGVRVSISYHSMRLIVSLTDEKLPGDVTEATVAAALTVEQRLASQAKHIIDPPDDSKHCVCPRYYPSFWEENPAQH